MDVGGQSPTSEGPAEELIQARSDEVGVSSDQRRRSFPRTALPDLSALARQASRAFNDHVRDCPECHPPVDLCWRGRAMDKNVSDIAAMRMIWEMAR